MERLTYWCEDGAGGGEWRINADGKEYSGPGVDRLAAYESTGQEPGGVLSATDLAKVACALHELNQYKELGTLDRLRCAVENLADAEARADEAEAALAAAVRDMEAMALTIRQRRDHDTECCPFCHYDCPEEDYCPGWEGEECFRWRGSDQSHKPTGDLSRDTTKMVPHIDLVAWKPCRVCGQYEALGFRGWRRQENMRKSPDGSGGCMYCPHCGRPRNGKALVQLEQRLRGERVDE